LKWIVLYISGYSQLKIISANPGGFISECAKSGVRFADIKRIDEITYYIKLADKYLYDVKNVCYDTHSEYQIVNTYGINSIFNKIKTRKFFVLGFFIFLLVIFLLTSFITDISVVGNDKLSDEQIIDMLEDAGFKKGMFAYNIDKKQIQKNVLKDNEQLAWLWIYVNGTTSTVNVRERVPKPSIKDDKDYSNCVASNKGLIMEVMPRYGKQMVFPGDVVNKGDLLISGISETKADDIRYMHADGIVMAKTWYEISGEYHHTRCDRHLTGNSKKLYNINILGNSIPLSKSSVLYKNFDKKDEVKKICNFLNLSFTISTYYEIIEESVEISDDEVITTAVKALEKDLRNNLKSKKDLNVDNITYDYFKKPSGNIVVTVYFECTEDIARYQKLPFGYTEDIDGKNSDV